MSSEDVAKDATPQETTSLLSRKGTGTYSELYDEAERAVAPQRGSVGKVGASLNMLNTILGAGIVGLSFVVSEAGVLPFIGFTLLCALLSYASLQSLVAATEFTSQKSYQSVGREAFGSVGAVLTSVAVLLQNFGGLTSYLILAGQSGPAVLKLFAITVNPTYLQIGAAVGLCYPLCLLKDLNLLSYFSFLAFCAFSTVAGYAVYTWVSMEHAGTLSWYANMPGGNDPINWWDFKLTAIDRMPTIIFAFVCHTACLPIYSQLHTPSKERMGTVNASSVSLAFLIYVATGVFGYLVYKGATLQNLMLNFRHCEEVAKGVEKGEEACKDELYFVSVLNAAFLVAVLIGYPSVHFPTRRAIIALIWGEEAEFSWPVHIVVASVTVAATLALAIFLQDDISFAFSWTGSVASPLLVFILPSLFYWRILGKQRRSLCSLERLWPLVTFVIGVLIMAACIIVKLGHAHTVLKHVGLSGEHSLLETMVDPTCDKPGRRMRLELED